MQIERVFLMRRRDAVTLGIVEEVENPEEATTWVEVRTDRQDDGVADFEARLQATSIVYFVRDERQFSRREIRSATALHLDPSRRDLPCRASGRDTWDWTDVCPRCMRIPTQVGPVSVLPEEVEGLAMARGRRGELIVSEQIATRMIKDGISGCILREVLFQQEGDYDQAPFFQVFPTSELPATFSPPTRFSNDADRCPVCARGGLYLNSMLYYDLPEDALEDVNVTAEVFGAGPGLYPELVVSRRFFNLLVSCGAEIADPEPVVFV